MERNFEKVGRDITAQADGVKNSVISSAHQLADQAGDLKGKIQRVGHDLAEESVAIAKKYPLHVAIGTAVVGFVAGSYLTRSRR